MTQQQDTDSHTKRKQTENHKKPDESSATQKVTGSASETDKKRDAKQHCDVLIVTSSIAKTLRGDRLYRNKKVVIRRKQSVGRGNTYETLLTSLTLCTIS